MKKKSLNRLSAFFNILLVVLLLLPNFIVSASVFAYDFPSTNQLNKDTGVRPYVEPNEIGVGYIKFNFINNHTKSLAFFEYKIDGNEKTSGTVHPVTGDFIYPGVSVDTRLILTPLTIERTLDAEQYIEIRLALGGERDWDFDWTRFDVLPVPVPPSIPVLEYPIDGVAINDNTPLMQWSDSTDSDGSVSHYLYRVFYNCTNVEDIPNSCSVYPNLDGLRVNASQYQAGTTNDNIYYWQVRAVDNEGNLSGWSEPEKLIIDTQGPNAPHIEFPLPEQYFNSTPILNDWTEVLGDLSGIKEYRIEYVYDDEHTFSGAPYRIATLSNRNHVPGLWEQGGVTIRVQAFDNAGNEGAWSEPVHYFYDANAPVVRLTSPSDNYFTNLTSVLQTWESDDTDIDYFEYESCSNDPDLDGFCTQIYSVITDNTSRTVNNNNITFWWRVRAVDLTGNVGSWTEAWKIAIDTLAPVVQITNPSNNSYVKGTVSFKGSVTDENLLRYYYYIGGVVANTVVSDLAFTDQEVYSWNTTNNPDGLYTMRLEARDKANNKTSVSVHEIKVTVDNTLPTGEITGIRYTTEDSTNFITNDKSPLLYGTYDDNYEVYTVEVKIGDVLGIVNLDNGNWSAQFSTLSDGIYTISLKITDKIGNITELSKDITIEPIVLVLQPVLETPAVLGTTTTTTPTPIVTRRPLVAANVLESSTEVVEEVPEILGEEDTTCTAESVSGHVYMDKDENNIWDQADESFSGIKIKITTKENDEEKIVEEFLTDEQGAWKTTLCAGTYYISIDTTSIPDGYKLIGDSTVKIDILDDTKDEVEQSFLLSESKTFLQKYWWIILLAILLVTGIVIASSKKEEQQYS